MAAAANLPAGESGASHFAWLDGLRGVAALAVVVFHVFLPLGVLAAPNGYLAVDFFFLLSGFVVANAYEARLKTGLSWPSFMGLRLARLYPLLFLGMLMGVLTALWIAPPPRAADVPPFVGAAVAEFLVLPLGRLPYAGDHPLFVFNAPAWSLFWEIAVNAAWAALAPRLGVRGLAILIGAAGATLAVIAARHGSLQIGAEAASFGGGAARVTVSFFCGVALHRMLGRGARFHWRPGPLLATAILALVLFAPVVIGSGVFDPLAILMIFPAVLVLAIGAEPTRAARRAARFVGDLSYPLYITHFPITRIFLHFAQSRRLAGGALDVLIVVELATIMIVATAALCLYDRPVRAWLRRRRDRSAGQRAAMAVGA
jgi:peptidoglycan/LPS O-acetylase OafA/YrhL